VRPLDQMSEGKDTERSSDISSLGTNLIKLEVIGDEKTLYPDLPELLSATKTLIKEDFVVMPYTSRLGHFVGALAIRQNQQE